MLEEQSRFGMWWCGSSNSSPTASRSAATGVRKTGSFAPEAEGSLSSFRPVQIRRSSWWLRDTRFSPRYCWTFMSSETSTACRVVVTDVTMDCSASIFKTRIQVSYPSSTARLWKWRKYNRSKRRWLYTNWYGARTQKTWILELSVMP